MFYEGLRILVREDLIVIRYVALLRYEITRLYFERYQPILEGGRSDSGTSRGLSESEYLHKEHIPYLGEILSWIFVLEALC